MFLLITCRYLEVADRRMTTTIKLIFAQAFVAGSTSLMHQLVRNRVLHRRPFPERGPSTPRLHLGAQLLLKLLILADAQTSALSMGGFGTLGSQGTRVTRCRRKLGRLAEDHRDGLATRTGHLHPRKVQDESILREKRTALRPGASDNVHALLRPLGNPWAGHVPQVDIELQQTWTPLQFLGQQLYRLMLWLLRRADYHLPRDFAIQIHGKVLLKAVEGLGAALAAVAHDFILDRDAPVRRDVLLETSPARSTLGVWFGVLRHQVGNRLHHLLHRRLLRRELGLLLQPALPSFSLLQDQPQGFLPRGGRPPIEIQRRFETAVPHQQQARVRDNRVDGRVQLLGCKPHELAQRMPEQVEGILDTARAEQRGRIQHRPQLPGAKATRLLCQRHRPLQQGLVQVVLDEPHAKVEQGALAEGQLLGVETIQHHLPALVHHREFHRIPIAHVAVGLQQRSEGQHPCFHGRFAARLWLVCLGQRVLQRGIQQLMASLAQKDKEFPGLACARYNLLLFRGQRNRWVPHNGLLKGTGFFAHHQTTLLPLLSTLYDPLPEQLISVLGPPRDGHG